MTHPNDPGRPSRPPVPNRGELPSRDDIVQEVMSIRSGRGSEAHDREHEIRRFRQTLLNRRGKFALLFAVCNDRVLQRTLTSELFARVSDLDPVELELTGQERGVLASLALAPGISEPLVVYGFDTLLPSSEADRERRERTLVELQHRRELFRDLGRPIVLWMPEYVFTMLGHEAVDFWSWRTGTFFFTDQSGPGVSGLETPAALPPIEPPREPESFNAVGRERELSAVLHALEEGRHVVLVGRAGVGKTSIARLAVQVAEHLFPDGAIFISLTPRPGEDDVAVTGLREIIRVLTPAVELPGSRVKLHAIYRDLLEGRRTLVVVDDVPDEKVARLFLPPPKCQLLLTSRVQLNLPTTEIIQIGALDLAESVRLLRTLMPETSAADARALSEWSGGEPLALRLAAGILNADRSLEPVKLIRALQPTKGSQTARYDTSTAVSRLIRAASDRLTPEEQRVLRAIAVFPTNFTIEAASAVSGENVELVLSRLQTYGLVTQERPNRFNIAPLVREYVCSRTGTLELHAAKYRHSRYFASILQTADELYRRPGPESGKEGLQLFETEWTNIQQGQAWAASHAESDEDAASLCVVYSVAAPNLTRARLSAYTRLEWLVAALDVARRRGAPELIGMLLLDAAEAHRTLGAPNRAAEYEREAGEWYTRLLTDATNGGNIRARAHAYSALAAQAFDEGDFSTATDRYITLSRVARDAAAPAVEAYAYGKLGEIARVRGDLAGAEDWYMRALSILAESDGNSVLLAQFLSGLIAVAYDRGAWDEAERWAREALELQEMLGDRAAVAALYHELGAIARRRGELGVAEIWFRRALEVQEALGNRRAVAALYHNLADILGRRADFTGAERLLQQTLREEENLGNSNGVAVASLQLGQLSLSQGNASMAEQWLRSAVDTAERLGNNTLRARATFLLAEASELRGDFERAASKYRVALEYSREIGDAELADAIMFRLAHLLTKWGRTEEGVRTNLEGLVESLQLGIRGDPQPNLQLLATQRELLGVERFNVLLRDRLEGKTADRIVDALTDFLAHARK